MKNVNEMTSKELKDLAKELKVKDWWTKKKAQLISDIEEIQADEKLLDHYDANWRKYGTRYDRDAFLADYKAGKITVKEESIEEIVGQDSLEDQAKDMERVETKKSETPKENKSRGKGKQIEFNGKSMNLNEWARELNMTRQTLYARLYIQNWDVEKAFTTPGRKAK